MTCEKGPGKNEQHAAAICANFPMRPQCGVYYYEMHVLSKGNDGYITIGFSTAESHVDRVPGKNEKVTVLFYSYGIHSRLPRRIMGIPR